MMLVSTTITEVPENPAKRCVNSSNCGHPNFTNTRCRHVFMSNLGWWQLHCSPPPPHHHVFRIKRSLTRKSLVDHRCFTSCISWLLASLNDASFDNNHRGARKSSKKVRQQQQLRAPQFHQHQMQTYVYIKAVWI